jgi:hypothetical protein
MTIEPQSSRGPQTPTTAPPASEGAAGIAARARLADRNGACQDHLILISTAAPVACLEAMSSVLSRAGGQVRGLSLKPVGLQFEAVLRLTGVDEAAADRVATMIGAWPDAGSVHVEHQWVRP